jgi:hypothetical protein
MGDKSKTRHEVEVVPHGNKEMLCSGAKSPKQKLTTGMPVLPVTQNGSDGVLPALPSRASVYSGQASGTAAFKLWANHWQGQS